MTPEHAKQLEDLLARAPVLPVLVIEDAALALPLARCLVESGLPVLEVTLRTPAALEAITRIRDALPEAVVGAGTVLDASTLQRAIAAGASFAIAPGATPSLYKAASGSQIPVLPGVATASEVMQGVEHGWRHFKFFPARCAGGPAALRALAGPFPKVRFCPTGGIGIEDAADYLALPNVMAVGGSWMVPPDALAGGDWSRIGALAARAARLRV